MAENNTRITPARAAASLELYRPPVNPAKLMHEDAIQLLALLRALSQKYGVSNTWRRSYERALLGRPPLAKDDDHLPAAARIACEAGETIVATPGEALRGLLIGIERGMHREEVET